MHGKFWINSIVATALGAAGLIQSTFAQPAPATAPAVQVDPLTQAVSVLSAPRANIDARVAAAQQLIAIRSPQSRQAVHDLLADGRLPESQMAVAQALADDPNPDRDPSYVDPLITMLSAPGAGGPKAAQALGIYKTGPQHEAVLNTLQSYALGSVRTTESARRAAIIALGQMVDQSAAATLMQLLTSASEAPEIHRIAAEALTSLSGDTHIGQDTQGWIQWWAVNQTKAAAEFRGELLANHANQLDALKRHYADLASDFRQFLDDVYHSTPVDARDSKLQEYLTSANPVVRAEGALIVYNDKTQGIPLPPKAQGRLQQMIADSDADVRLAVANALAVLNDRSALRPLLDQLAREQVPGVRASLARALGQIGDVQALPTLLPLLDDRSLVVATAAARAIAGLGAQLQTIPVNQARDISSKLQQLVLNRANNPGAEDLREQAISAMAELRDPTLLPIFQGILNNPNESASIRQKAVHGIGNIGDPKTADLIGQIALKDPDIGVRGEAVKVLPAVNGTAYAGKLVDMQVPPNADDPAIQDLAWTALQSFLPNLDDLELQNFAQRFLEQDMPAKRIDVLKQIADHQRKANQSNDMALTLMNIGESQMNPKVNDFEGAAANFDAAITAVELEPTVKPDSVVMVQLTQLRTQALLHAGKYSDAVAFAQQVLAKNPQEVGDLGTYIRDEADALERSGNLDKAMKLIDESEKLQLKPTTRDDLSATKTRIAAQIEKNKGSGYVVPTPIQINANNGATAKVGE